MRTVKRLAGRNVETLHPVSVPDVTERGIEERDNTPAADQERFLPYLFPNSDHPNVSTSIVEKPLFDGAGIASPVTNILREIRSIGDIIWDDFFRSQEDRGLNVPKTAWIGGYCEVRGFERMITELLPFTAIGDQKSTSDLRSVKTQVIKLIHYVTELAPYTSRVWVTGGGEFAKVLVKAEISAQRWVGKGGIYRDDGSIEPLDFLETFDNQRADDYRCYVPTKELKRIQPKTKLSKPEFDDKAALALPEELERSWADAEVPIRRSKKPIGLTMHEPWKFAIAEAAKRDGVSRGAITEEAVQEKLQRDHPDLYASAKRAADEMPKPKMGPREKPSELEAK